MNYAEGERFFEIDFDITSDGVPVCIHGWESMKDFVNGEIRPHTHLEYMRLRRKDGLTHIDINGLASWLIAHPDSYIITDVKSNNVEVLFKISSLYPNLRDRFIPQIYKLREYDEVRKLGFDKVIL